MEGSETQLKLGNWNSTIVFEYREIEYHQHAAAVRGQKS